MATIPLQSATAAAFQAHPAQALRRSPHGRRPASASTPPRSSASPPRSPRCARSASRSRSSSAAATSSAAWPRRRTAWIARQRRLHGHAGDGDELAGAAGRARARRRRPRACCRRSRCRSCASRTSAAAPCATSRRGAWSSSPPAPAIPYFTTDTAASLRAMEIHADVLLKATKVDGVYDKDPVKHPDARALPSAHLPRGAAANLKVMDSTAISLCRDNKLAIVVFDLRTRGNIRRVVDGRVDRHAGHRRGEPAMVNDILKDLEGGIAKAHDSLKRELAKVRTGRANLALSTACASTTTARRRRSTRSRRCSTPDARLIIIKPWEKKLCPAIEEAIRKAELGVNPSVRRRAGAHSDPVADRGAPPRADQGRQAHGRGRARRHPQPAPRRQRDAQGVPEGGDITEDDAQQGRRRCRPRSTRAIEKVDELASKKEAEIMEV